MFKQTPKKSKFKTRIRMMGIFATGMALGGVFLGGRMFFFFIKAHPEIPNNYGAVVFILLPCASTVGGIFGGFIGAKIISLYLRYYWYPKIKNEK